MKLSRTIMTSPAAVTETTSNVNISVMVRNDEVVAPVLASKAKIVSALPLTYRSVSSNESVGEIVEEKLSDTVHAAADAEAVLKHRRFVPAYTYRKDAAEFTAAAENIAPTPVRVHGRTPVAELTEYSRLSRPPMYTTPLEPTAGLATNAFEFGGIEVILQTCTPAD
jgi:hypothetical protein